MPGGPPIGFGGPPPIDGGGPPPMDGGGPPGRGGPAEGVGGPIASNLFVKLRN